MHPFRPSHQDRRPDPRRRGARRAGRAGRLQQVRLRPERARRRPAGGRRRSPRSCRAQLLDAKPGSVIEIPAGHYHLDRGLSLRVNGVTIHGAGMEQTILSFRNQVAGPEGLLAQASDFTHRGPDDRGHQGRRAQDQQRREHHHPRRARALDGRPQDHQRRLRPVPGQDEERADRELAVVRRGRRRHLRRPVAERGRARLPRRAERGRHRDREHDRRRRARQRRHRQHRRHPRVQHAQPVAAGAQHARVPQQGRRQQPRQLRRQGHGRRPACRPARAWWSTRTRWWRSSTTTSPTT